MIEVRNEGASATRHAGVVSLQVTRVLDDNERMIEHLRSLDALIDARLPTIAARADLDQAEADAMTIIRHLEQFAGARYSRRQVNGYLYGLRMAGVTVSATAGRFSLLRAWQRAARERIEVMS